MGTVAVKIKLMPESSEVNLEDVKAQAQKAITERGGKIIHIDTEDVAFGIKAIIITLAWPEAQSVDALEAELGEDIDGVSSAQIIDYRRAIG